MNSKITVTLETLAEAFTEWDRRWREDPDGFQSDVVRLLKGETPDTYGEACAPYFASIIESLAPGDAR